MDDEVTVISTYFVVGDCVYMAPSVASVVVIRHHKLQTLHCFQSGFESFARLDKMTEGIVVVQAKPAEEERHGRRGDRDIYILRCRRLRLHGPFSCVVVLRRIS
jgi:hypothetical protein